MKRLHWVLCSIAAVSCAPATPASPPAAPAQASAYLDNTGRADLLSGGVRMIPIHTPKGDF